MFGFSGNQAFKRIIGHAPSLDAVIRTAQIAAAADVHILIEGDTGTGKELLAQAIRESSQRAEQPFIVINCAALPEELVDSLLFGHEAGAFTGATERKDGYIQSADKGTLFLDEIGELPLAVQAKLLRFVENGECQRVGGHATETVDVRILAATHRNLPDMVAANRFRQDLFYRLSVVNLRLPTLRERSRDIPELVERFLAEAAERNRTPRCTFDADAMQRLRHYHWPGNIRELRNVCLHVSTLLPGKRIGVDDLPPEIRQQNPAASSGFRLPEEGIDMETLEIDLIKQALTYTDGNKSHAAKMLGLSRDAFMYRLKKFKLG